MSQNPTVTTEEGTELLIDFRDLQQAMQEAKPGQRIVIQEVVSCHGVVVWHEDGHITPRQKPDGTIAFDCMMPDGDRLTIDRVDSYLWSIQNVQ